MAPGFAAENVLKAGGFFGICGFASVDWVNCEFSCQYLGAAACTAFRLGMDIMWLVVSVVFVSRTDACMHLLLLCIQASIIV